MANFVGDWVLEKHEGYEQYLEVMGFNPITRKAAACAAVDGQKVSIKLDGEKMIIEEKFYFSGQTVTVTFGEELEMKIDDCECKGTYTKVSDDEITGVFKMKEGDKEIKCSKKIVDGKIIRVDEVGDVKVERTMKKVEQK